MADGALITAVDLELAVREPGPDLDLRGARHRAEREAIERALARAGGSIAAAARLLGISRPTLYGLLETHGVTIPRGGSDADTDAGAT